MAKITTERPHAAGCIAYLRGAGGAPLVLMIKDQYGRWTLPKGHLEAGEDAPAAAERETLEETGVAGDLGPFVGEISYAVTTRRGERFTKRVAFYLLRAAGSDARPEQAEGISAVGWFAPAEALARNGYDDVRQVLRRALEMIAAELPPSDGAQPPPRD